MAQIQFSKVLEQPEVERLRLHVGASGWLLPMRWQIATILKLDGKNKALAVLDLPDNCRTRRLIHVS